MGALKVYISGSMSGDKSLPHKISEFLKTAFGKRVEIVHPLIPWTDESKKQLLDCDFLVVIPPDTPNYCAGINVGRGQFEIVNIFYNDLLKLDVKDPELRILIVNNVDDGVEVSIVEPGQDGKITLLNTGITSDWQCKFGWIDTDSANIDINEILMDFVEDFEDEDIEEESIIIIKPKMHLACIRFINR
jgi:hypothetical protein